MLHYIEKGTGFPLVLLHGNSDSSHFFRHQIDYFSHYYRVIAIDTRGHGKSKRGTAPFTLNQFVKDLKQFLDTLGLSQVYLLGMSDGANIALLFALKYQHYIRKLVLNAAVLSPAGLIAPVRLGVAGLYYIFAACAKLAAPIHKLKEAFHLMKAEPNICPTSLYKVRIPCLVIVGTHDVARKKHTQLIAESLPNSTLEVVKGTHFVARDNPEPFNLKVHRFLN